jgi:hypothetical protein
LTDVSEVRTASIMKAMSHGAISKKTVIFTLAAVRTSLA